MTGIAPQPINARDSQTCYGRAVDPIVTIPRAPRFATLDAMRGVAAIAVAAMHWSKIDDLGWLPSAYLAVDLFFVLSGFVIALAYDNRLASGLAARQFMTVRVIRLYPLYALGTALAALLVVSGIDADWSRGGFALALGSGAVMLPALPHDDFGTLYPLNDPAWTLMFELLANAAFAVGHRWLSTRVLTGWVATAALVLLVVVLDEGSMERGWAWEGVAVGLARVMFAFPAGVLLCRWYRAGRLPDWHVPPLLIVAAMAAVLALPAHATGDALRDVGIAALLWPLLVVAGVGAPLRRAAVVGGWLGRISYPLYAVHGPVMALIMGVAAGAAVPVPVLLALLGGLVLLCGGLDRNFDAPVRRWLAAAVEARSAGARGSRAAP